MESVVIRTCLWGADMDFEDIDIVEVNDNDGIEITIQDCIPDGYIYITDKELLALCRMRGLID
ncbi:hypothetical protein [Pseudoalteromonas marina]|uniref:hypothetical protein n=1 Tax=Pseudoalteromonas marina TaxID=267375 RepID=UPI0023F50C7C|nr:hypothetical protein [Pseudoalteromonas marina]